MIKCECFLIFTEKYQKMESKVRHKNTDKINFFLIKVGFSQLDMVKFLLP